LHAFPILYLHGFASSPFGRKVERLREILTDPYEIHARDLNVPSFEKLSFDDMVRVATGAANKIRAELLIGSSLGALVALELARKGLGVPLVLVAPALGFGVRWVEKLPPGDPIPFFHHGQGREIPIHRAFFEDMASRNLEAVPPAPPVSIVMGEQDESVPYDGVRRVWEEWEGSGRLAPGSRFVSIPGGDHGLVDHVDRIADEVRRLVG
jgi:pimeloyl-ACP methyl ester carboxylesterase